ncbi:hypothetical protein QL285_010919 [Trifolium repens]|nr:hypothetical protein QL285_010919 [Trifolium repens]
MSSKRSRDSISHSRLAPSLDNKVGLHNLLVFRVAAAEHISQLLLEAVTIIVSLVVAVHINELSSHSQNYSELQVKHSFSVQFCFTH